MGKVENVTIYKCDACGKIELPIRTDYDPDHENDLPTRWTRWFSGAIFCPSCSRAYLYGCGAYSIVGTGTTTNNSK